MRVASVARSIVSASRAFSTSSSSYAPQAFRFPAMSPTMTEGGIASWKLKEGDSFAAGDVILEIETDKATIDVESQDDGILGKIILADGTKEIKVGTLIAITAEEGDDISNLDPAAFDGGDAAPSASSSASTEPSTPEPSSSSSSPSSSSTSDSASSSSHSHSAPKISHARPILPSVHRLLTSSSLSASEITALKGTGFRGMLTKGDVLKATGKISSAFGSKEAESLWKASKLGVAGRFKLPSDASSSKPAAAAAKPSPPQTPSALRQAIVAGLLRSASPPPPSSTKSLLPPSFESVLADYAPPTPAASAVPLAASLALFEAAAAPRGAVKSEFDGLW